jgi:hypothetical protein
MSFDNFDKLSGDTMAPRWADLALILGFPQSIVEVPFSFAVDYRIAMHLLTGIIYLLNRWIRKILSYAQNR